MKFPLKTATGQKQRKNMFLSFRDGFCLFFITFYQIVQFLYFCCCVLSATWFLYFCSVRFPFSRYYLFCFFFFLFFILFHFFLHSEIVLTFLSKVSNGFCQIQPKHIRMTSVIFLTFFQRQCQTKIHHFPSAFAVAVEHVLSDFIKCYARKYKLQIIVRLIFEEELILYQYNFL